jgi:hypothetical protein
MLTPTVILESWAPGCYTFVTLLLHRYETVVILSLHCCHTVVTLLLHCCYTVVTGDTVSGLFTAVEGLWSPVEVLHH